MGIPAQRPLIDALEPRRLLAAIALFDNAKNAPVNPEALTVVGNSLFFFADTDTGAEFSYRSHRQLWKTNGTRKGTVQVSTNLPETDRYPRVLTAVMENVLYFIEDKSLWRSDGTTAGTTRLTKRATYDPRELVVAGSHVYFDATYSAYGNELWCYDDAGGARLLANIVPGGKSSSPANLTNVNGTLFFAATDDAHGRELWKSDGTSAGTVLVADIGIGKGGSFPVSIAASGNRVYYVGNDTDSSGQEVFVSDGSAAGTHTLTNLSSSSQPLHLDHVSVVGSHVFIGGEQAVSNAVSNTINLSKALYSLDIKHPGNVQNLFNGETSITGTDPVKPLSGETGYFSKGSGGFGGPGWYFTDGTTAGTRIATFFSPSYPVAANGRLYFEGESPLLSQYASSNGGGLNAGGVNTWYGPQRAVWQTDGNLDSGTIRLDGSDYDYGFASETAVLGSKLFIATTRYAGSVTSGNLFVQDIGGGSLSGVVYNDINGNAVRDDEEWSRIGTTVFLDQNANGVLDNGERSAVTDDNGVYHFTGLPAGTYRVAVVTAGRIVTTQPVVVREADGRFFHRDFGLAGASIGGAVFNDANRNGIRDAGETPLRGAYVYIDKNGNGLRDAREPLCTTTGTGRYTFTDLLAGTYTIGVMPKTGWTATTRTSARITVAAGAAATRHFGRSYIARATITAAVFWDTNHNGVHDNNNNEDGGSPVGVYLVRKDTDAQAGKTLFTNPAIFTDLLPGTYVIKADWNLYNYPVTSVPLEVTVTEGQNVTRDFAVTSV